MSVGTYRFIYRLAQTVNPTDGAVFGQRMPGVEGQIVAEQVLFVTIEVLRLHGYARDAFEGRYLFAPYHWRIFDGHVVLRVLFLHLKFEACGGAIE